MERLIIKVEGEEKLCLEDFLVKNPFLFKGTFFNKSVKGLTSNLYLTFNPEVAISYSIAKTLQERAKEKDACPVVLVYFPFNQILPDYPVSTIESVTTKINNKDKYVIINLEDVVERIEMRDNVVYVTYSQERFRDLLSGRKSIEERKIRNLVNLFFDEIEASFVERNGKLPIVYREQLNYFLNGHLLTLHDTYKPFKVIHVPSLTIFPKHLYFNYKERISSLIEKLASSANYFSISK